LQASHCPPQARSQQTPSVQKAQPHSVSHTGRCWPPTA
jgi:hypothetical protein